jgi:hypothetical protein
MYIGIQINTDSIIIVTTSDLNIHENALES